jgi:hypothetical protein
MSTIPSTSPSGPKPVDNPHTCVLCGKKIRKNRESYRGHMPAEMLAAIRAEKPGYHVKQDICLECGKKYYDQVAGKMKKKPWLLGRLG